MAVYNSQITFIGMLFMTYVVTIASGVFGAGFLSVTLQWILLVGVVAFVAGYAFTAGVKLAS